MTWRGKCSGFLLVVITFSGAARMGAASERSWRRVTRMAAAPVTALAVHAGGDRIAAASGGSVYLSADGGRSWRSLERVGGEIDALAFVGDDRAAPLLVAWEGGVRWVGAGAAGRPLDLALVSGRGRVRALGVRPGMAGPVAFGTGNGVVVAGLEKDVWREIATAIPGRSFRAVAWEAGGGIVAAGEEGLFRFDPKEPGDPERLTSRSARDVASSGDATLAVTQAGLLARRGGGPWREVSASDGPSREAEAAGPAMNLRGAFVVADPLSVWRVEAGSVPRRIADAPPGETTTAIIALPDGRLLGATDRGLFEYPAPGAVGTGSREGDGPRRLADGFAGESGPGFGNRALLPRGSGETPWRAEPAIAAVRRAAIHSSHLDPGRIRRNFRGVRYRGLLPELELSLRRRHVTAFDRDRDQAFTGGALRNLFDTSRDRDRERDFVMAAEWDLGSLLFNPDELDVSEEARRVLTLRDDVLDEVNHIYFERRRAALALATLRARRGATPGEPYKDQEEAVALRIKIDELTARLDSWTEGFFSREMARLSKGEDGRAPHQGF